MFADGLNFAFILLAATCRNFRPYPDWLAIFRGCGFFRNVVFGVDTDHGFNLFFVGNKVVLVVLVFESTSLFNLHSEVSAGTDVFTIESLLRG